MDQGELFAKPPRPHVDGPIYLAAVETIEALRTHGAIDATHALKVALIKQGAAALDREFDKEKITVAATTLFSKVIDVADGLPSVQEAVTKSFDALVEAMHEAE